MSLAFVLSILFMFVAGLCLGYAFGRGPEKRAEIVPALPNPLPYDKFPLRIKAVLRAWGTQPPESIGEIAIVNDATGTEEIGNYQVQLIEHKLDQDPVIRNLIVTGHKRKEGAWALVAQILREAGINGEPHRSATRVPVAPH